MRLCIPKVCLGGIIAWLDSMSQALEILAVAGGMCRASIITLP